MMSELKASWKPDSMAWVNLHVAGYYYTLDGVTHPRQLASCCLRLDSTQECRWSCWACNLNPAEAAAAGFFPPPNPLGTRALHSSTIGGLCVAKILTGPGFTKLRSSILQYLLAADLDRWPFPWTSFALKALPREIPSRDGGHNPRLWEAPFHRKPTPLDAPSEMRNKAIATQSSEPAAQPKSNKPRSPPRGAIDRVGMDGSNRLLLQVCKGRALFPPATLPELGCLWQGQDPLAPAAVSVDASHGLLLVYRATLVFPPLHQDGGNCCSARPRCCAATS